jgi:hypothetical protein
VGNKVNEEEIEFLKNESPGLPLLGMLPVDLSVQEADRLGLPVYDHVPALRLAAELMAIELDKLVVKEPTE